ncbi:sugar-binding domain-containing protein [Niabella ginsengisoli]|uniref:Beta galactosidase jelly roll domain-containing protein n=1 Tax=Niabella ginsengisoli TaxID=522298 RepID=A0ABS9SIR9_9BACT|nr:sugar-binding domain-containing protein [Niabella ginsengisoli]MCH5598244.1 beta galactosidase jelly roll domain-containing protein [Niabella ginsengisoli]
MVILIFTVFLSALGSVVYAQQEENNRINFDQDWRFHLGDTSMPYASGFNDTKWRVLHLPHDWSIEQPFDLKSAAGWQGGYLPGGIGWYRKTFEWNKKDQQHVMIQFDGVYMNSEVWINGHYLGKRPYGYISYEYELTPYLRNGKNIIAVKADNSKLPSGRWYTGSGIYRHVWLRTTSNIYVPQWGTYITTPKVSAQQADIAVRTELKNSNKNKAGITLQTTIIAPNGQQISSISKSLKLDTATNVHTQDIAIRQPELWSPSNPVRYKLVQRIISPDQPDEIYTTYFGIRSIRVNAKEGFVLNEKSIKLNGVCNHHDAGPVGSAVPEDVLYRRLKLLKDMGCNAIRTTHNPAAPELYTICDTLGLMVLDEAFDGWDKPKAANDYGLYFNEWWQKDLTDFIKRDRNHPSIVMWSIGNEVPKFEVALQKKLADVLKSLDTTPGYPGKKRRR